MHVTYILLGALACILTSLAMGLAALRLLRIDLDRAEAICLSYVVGAALNSTVTFFVAALWIARKGVFVAISVLALIVLWRELRWLRGLKPARFTGTPAALKTLFVVALAVYGLIYFRQALAPETSADGITYHLGLVNLWSHVHGLSKDLTMYAALPEGMEMLFLFAFSIGRHSAAALVHLTFLMVLPVMMLLYGSRFGWTRGSAVFAALLIFASPLVGVNGVSAMVDVALAAVAFAAVYFLQIWREGRQRGALFACCALAGFGCAIKYTGGLLMLFVMLMLLLDLRREPPRRAARTLLAAAALMLAFPAPYLVRNYVWFENPIAFFGNSIFRNPYFHVSFEKSYVASMAALHELTWREIPRELTFGSNKTFESFGPVFLILPVVVIAVLWRQPRPLLAAGAFLACGYIGNKTGRFLIPAVPFFAMAAAWVLSRIPRAPVLLGIIAAVHLVISWPYFLQRFPIQTGTEIVPVSWDVALRHVPEERYLASHDDYQMARLVESHVPDGESVLTITGGIAQSYTARPVLVRWESGWAETVGDVFELWRSPFKPRRRWVAHFPSISAREVRILQTARDDAEMWTIPEIRLWNGSTGLPRSAAWRLDSFPNRWDIGLAFDGSEATRWRSWEELRPDMWIDVRFDRPQRLDRVDVVIYDPKWRTRMTARVRTDRGDWITASSTKNVIDPPLDLRRASTESLKRRGVHWFEVSREVWYNAAFRGQTDAWGLKLVAETPNSLLFHVE